MRQKKQQNNIQKQKSSHQKTKAEGHTVRQKLVAYRTTTALFLLLSIAVLWITADGYLHLTRPPETRDITVPNFRGMDADNLPVSDWQEIVTEYRYDAESARGEVIMQSPPAGSLRRLYAGETCRITLTVSLGAEQITLPQVVGMEVRAATEALRSAGFTVVTEVVTSPENDGRVLVSTPNGGTKLSRGSRVTLTVGMRAPQETVTVPDVVGMERSEALILLSLSGLSVKEIIETEDPTSPGGCVTAQSHQGGTVVRIGTRLTLTVAREE